MLLHGDKLSASAQDQLRKSGGKGGLGRWQEKAGRRKKKNKKKKAKQSILGTKLLTGLLRRREEEAELKQRGKMGEGKGEKGRETHKN